MRHYGEQAGIHCLNKGWKFIEKDFSILPPMFKQSCFVLYIKEQ